MEKQSSVGNLPEVQVAPGSPCCSRGFPKGQHQRGSPNLSHSVCSEMPIYLGAVSGVSPLPWGPEGICRPSRFYSGSFRENASDPSALAALCSKFKLGGWQEAVGEETEPATLQGPSASV